MLKAAKMASLLGSTSTSRMSVSKAFGASRPRPVVSRAPVSRKVVVVRAGLFDFLAPKPAAPAVNPRAQELSEALIDICSSTAAGSKASSTTKQEIEELVAELAQYSLKNPVKSPLLWGTYDVLYCSKPTAVGGPLKAGAGPVVAPGQVARQILEAPDSLVNEVTFKALGFLPGYSRQFGTITPLSGDTFQLSITEGELNFGVTKQAKTFNINRKIQIVYLDETLRIARFLPSEELSDSEAEEAQGGPESEQILFVFARSGQEAEEEAEEEEPAEEEQEERAASPVLGLFGGGTRKVESFATQVERQVEQQRTRKGTQAFFLGGRSRDAEEEEEEEERDDPRAARERERAAAQARKQREADEKRAAAERARQEAASAKAAEQARIAKEKEAAAKARAAQEARERAEQEKAERAERQAAIREQLAELAEELKEAQAEAREAAKAAREVARENQGVLKQVAAAEGSIRQAEQEVEQVSVALEEAGQARKAAEQQLKQAQQAVKEAEAAYKQKVAAR